MRRLLCGLILVILAAPALAQDDAPAMLVADHVFINADRTLTAEGAVEVFYRGVTLTAERIVYDNEAGQLTIEGPITLTDGEGTVILADAAALSADLTAGVMTSARMVLDQQLQLAAAEIARLDGRFTELNRVVASSCEVCPSNPVPLWEIRARRIIHDQRERQLYFENAHLRVAGVPVFYLPRLRLPDPTVERATGFLTPSLRSTSELGPGLKLPYFIAFGDSRDLTITPYYALDTTRTLDLRYRQAFRWGEVLLEGALSRDDILPGELRSYLFGEGVAQLPKGFQLDMQIQTVSDPAYLLDYDISDEDRLTSGFRLSRTRRSDDIQANLLHFESIRAGDDNTTLPSRVGDLTFRRRFTPDYIFGEGGFSFEATSLWRESGLDYDANGDGVTDGRDVSRAGVSVDWRRNWILPTGMVASGAVEVHADYYAIHQDAAFPDNVTRIFPAAAAELRWPWVRAEAAGGATQIIEPVAQVVISPSSSEAVPNEDSVLVEFDEGNLFGFSRFPGNDLREGGLRLNLGASWTRQAPEGWSSQVTFGRVIRADDLHQFSAASGLGGSLSDWLVAAQVTATSGLAVTNRAIFDDSLSFSSDELRLAWIGDDGELSAGYLWQTPDPAQDRPLVTSEISFDGAWQIADGWHSEFSGRYDFESQSATRAAVGLEYRTECAAFDLSLSRRFTSSTSVNADTNLNLSVELSGFGSDAEGRSVRRSCGP